MQTFLIVGLGNPGKEYTFTRHNIGFRLIENWLANLSLIQENCPCNLTLDKKHQALIAKIKTSTATIILVEPQTFMNDSGKSIKSLLSYYDIPVENMLVVHDDLSFEFGKFKLSKNSGPAGHNGIKSIIQNIGTQDFARLRIGIASRMGCSVNHQSGHNFVLGNFSKEEESDMDILFENVNKILPFFIETDFDKTANKFNGDLY